VCKCNEVNTLTMCISIVAYVCIIFGTCLACYVFTSSMTFAEYVAFLMMMPFVSIPMIFFCIYPLVNRIVEPLRRYTKLFGKPSCYGTKECDIKCVWKNECQEKYRSIITCLRNVIDMLSQRPEMYSNLESMVLMQKLAMHNKRSLILDTHSS